MADVPASSASKPKGAGAASTDPPPQGALRATADGNPKLQRKEEAPPDAAAPGPASGGHGESIWDALEKRAQARHRALQDAAARRAFSGYD
ncbi:hypothetical protein ACP70R_031238 [Stipagrostis hirtigluma subsp. patula]